MSVVAAHLCRDLVRFVFLSGNLTADFRVIEVSEQEVSVFRGDGISKILGCIALYAPWIFSASSLNSLGCQPEPMTKEDEDVHELGDAQELHRRRLAGEE